MRLIGKRAAYSRRKTRTRSPTASAFTIRVPVCAAPSKPQEVSRSRLSCEVATGHPACHEYGSCAFVTGETPCENGGLWTATNASSKNRIAQ